MRPALISLLILSVWPAAAQPTPRSLTFTWVRSAALPAPQTVRMTGPWAATVQDPWVSVSPTSGSSDTPIQVSVAPQGLRDGSYTGTVLFRQTSFPFASGTLTVNLTITSSTSETQRIQVDASPISTELFVGAERRKVVAVRSVTSSTSQAVSYSVRAISDHPFGRNFAPFVFVRVLPGLDPNGSPGTQGGPTATGVTPSTLVVIVDSTGFAPGREFRGSIEIRTTGASDPVITIALAMSILGVNSLVVDPPTVQLAAPSTLSRRVAVSSQADPLDFTASVVPAGTQWLSVTPAQDTSPKEIEIAVRPGGLVPSAVPYQARIDFRDTSNVAVSLNVFLTVTAAAPTLIVEPTSVTFRQQRGGPAPPPQNIRVRASDNSIVPLNVQGNAAWFAGTIDSPMTPAVIALGVENLPFSVRTYDGQLTVSSPGASAAVVVPVRFEMTESSSRNIAQIANGDDFVTTVTLVNNDTVDAPYSLRFRSSQGTEFSVATSGVSHALSGTVPRGGSRTIQTNGAGPTTSGWGELVTDRNISGTAIYRWRQSGRPDQEAAVPVTSTPFRRFMLPFDNQGTFSTSMAIANLNMNSTAVIEATVRDQNGLVLGRSSVPTLPPGGHIAFELRNTIPATVGQLGAVEFSSTADVSVVGLRFNNAQGTMTSFDPLPLDTGAVRPRQSMSQIADGGQFQTTITLVNLDTVEAPYSVGLRTSNGSPWDVVLAAGSHPLSGSIPIGGVRVIRTAGVGVLRVGWAEVTSSRLVAGMAVYRQRSAGGAEQEAAVPINPAGTRRFLLPFENSGGFTTSMAVANLDLTAGCTVNATIRDETGVEVQRQALDPIPPAGHAAFELKNRIAASANRRGVAEFTSTCDLSVVGLRFNDITGAFTSFRSVQ